jgi:type VI secretion system protein VasG
MASNLKALVARMTPVARVALEQAVELCQGRSHAEIDIEHFLMTLVEAENTDWSALLKHLEIDRSRVERRLTKALDDLESGSARRPTFSTWIPRLLERAWLEASIAFDSNRIRTGHILLALLDDPQLSRLALALVPEFEGVSVEKLRTDLDAATASSAESQQAAKQSADTAAAPAAKKAGRGGSILEQYTVNLTTRAREGKLDPVLGRDPEIRQMIDILTRRRQNNPILTGEPGVGKTAVVEGLALRIAAGDVPPSLREVELVSLDLGLLQAGASVKGEFENRLRGVIDEVKSSPKPMIVFIDEAHTLIGAGGAAGQNDAANLLKPALARGEMRTIAATTWSEYKKYFEKDAALARRFQVVKVDEPDEARARLMLRGVVTAMEKHHQISILQEAVEQAVYLSSRYITARQLPDKAVSVLDTACARIRIGQTSTPAPVEDATRQIEGLESAIASLQREKAKGADHSEQITRLASEREAAQTTLADLKTRWEKEKALVDQIIEADRALDAVADDAQKQSDAITGLAALKTQLREVQNNAPLVQAFVDGNTVAQVIAAWTGVPVGKMVGDEIRAVLALKDRLEQRVIGQPHALEAIAQRIRTARANLEDPSKPKGVFLLVGTSGVGKTETGLALADALYGGERNIITINMSEYQEAHTVSSLKGSPPGYVGYGEGGVLTEAIRRRPYSVLLLDEVEKAHPDVLELFFQVFDKGVLEDGEGREIDFKNTIILLTSNAATDTIMRVCFEAEELPSVESLNKIIRPELQAIFKPAFLGRLAVIPYYPLRDDDLKMIVRLKLEKIRKRFQANHSAQFVYTADLVDEIAARCNESESGARNIDNLLAAGLLPEISGVVLERMASAHQLRTIRVLVDEHRRFRYEVE